MPIIFQPPVMTLLVVLSAWLFMRCWVRGRPLFVSRCLVAYWSHSAFRS